MLNLSPMNFMVRSMIVPGKISIDVVTLSHIASILVRSQDTRMQIGDHGGGRTDPYCRECVTKPN
jgi:hypothetical protein